MINWHGSGNGLVLSGNKPLPEPVLTQISMLWSVRAVPCTVSAVKLFSILTSNLGSFQSPHNLCCHMVSLDHSELMHWSYHILVLSHQYHSVLYYCGICKKKIFERSAKIGEIGPWLCLYTWHCAINSHWEWSGKGLGQSFWNLFLCYHL